MYRLVKIKLHSLYILFTLIGLHSGALYAGEFSLPERPNPPRLVNNLSGEFPDFFSDQQEQALESKLVQFNNSTSNQIAIVVMDDLGGSPASAIAPQIINKWGIGQADKKNGVLILINPSNTYGKREVFIATGYGLEGAIPDYACKQIVDKEIIPFFKERKFYEGVDAAVNTLMGLAKNEINVANYAKKKKRVPFKEGALVVLIIIIVIFILTKRNGRNGGFTINRGGGFFYGGGWGGSSWGGGGSSWGGSSGGFGGFGGGSSGGGGAGGSW